MSYAPKRPHLSKKVRASIFARDAGVCHWCGKPIDGDYAIDHVIARELGGGDDPDNLAPIHVDPCHKEKTALDVAAIAKSNRIRKKHGPAEQRPKTKHPIRSRGFQKGGTGRKLPSRPFRRRDGKEQSRPVPGNWEQT